MPRKPHLILLVVVALGALAILALPDHTRSRVRMAFAGIFLPLFGLTGSVQSALERVASAFTAKATWTGRLEALERENERLRLALTEAEVSHRENDRLRQMLGYAQRSRWELKPARVIGRDPSHWWRSVHLDVGLRHGVTPNLAVLTPEGLVGRVAEAGPWTSRVVLLGDPNCPVAVAVVETGEAGIVRGASGGDLEGSLVDVSYLSRNAVVRSGQRVVTSGQGGVFPRGIPVGEVVDARAVGDGIYLEARARLSVNLGTLDVVWVKLP